MIGDLEEIAIYVMIYHEYDHRGTPPAWQDLLKDGILGVSEWFRCQDGTFRSLVIEMSIPFISYLLASARANFTALRCLVHYVFAFFPVIIGAI
jgi:hypothetical protein